MSINNLAIPPIIWNNNKPYSVLVQNYLCIIPAQYFGYTSSSLIVRVSNIIGLVFQYVLEYLSVCMAIQLSQYGLYCVVIAAVYSNSECGHSFNCGSIFNMALYMT